jgi:hypothetical protein
MALTKITSTNIGANAVTSSALSNTALISALGYTPANKAGDTFTNNINIGYDGYPSLKYKNAAGTDKAEIYVGTSAGDLNIVVGAGAAIAIDSSARVRMPYQPAFVVTKNGGVSGTLSSNTVLDFSYSVLNRGSHYNTSTYRFTAPVAGYYMFYVHLYHQLSAGGYTRIMIKKNGTELTQGTDVIPHAFVQTNSAGAGDYTSSTSIIFDLAVNDYVNVAVRTGQNAQWYGGHSLFYGYLLG